VLPPPKLTRYQAVVENAEELRRTVNLRRVWSEYDGFDHRLSNGRYRRTPAADWSGAEGPNLPQSGH